MMLGLLDEEEDVELEDGDEDVEDEVDEVEEGSSRAVGGAKAEVVEARFEDADSETEAKAEEAAKEEAGDRNGRVLFALVRLDSSGKVEEFIPTDDLLELLK